MDNRINIKTKTRLGPFITLIIGGVFFCSISYYLISISLNSEFPQIAGLLLGLFFGAFGIASFLSIWQLKKYEFDGEKLIVNSIFNTRKKVIYIKNIKSYNEIEKENKYRSWKDLSIFTDRHKVTLSSYTVTNYLQLKSALTQGIQRDEYSERMWLYKFNRRYGFGFIIIGLLFTLGILNVNSKKDSEIKSEQLTTIVATIAKTPAIERQKSSRWINLKLKEFPKFTFEIHGIRFRASNSNAIVSEIQANDQIELDILKTTYDKKISRTKPLSFLDKTINHHLVSVNGLRKNGAVYLKLEDINSAHKEDSSGFGFWMLLIVGIVITLSGLFLLSRKKPSPYTE